MILVTGSTGNVGSEVVKQLAAGGHKVRALVVDTAEGSKFPTTVDTVAGNLDNIDSLVNAMKGVDHVYLLAPLTPALQKHEANAIEAAKRAKVKHVVKHSVLGANYEAVALGKWHRAGEKALEASGVGWTHLRPSAFHANSLWWAQTIKTQGAVYQPTGDGKIASIDPRDIAGCAVEVLTKPGHEGKSYELTGPAALSASDQCDIIGRVLGKPVKFVNVPDQAARDSMLAMGMPAQIVDLMIEFMGLVRSGQAAAVTDTVQKLTGKPSRSFEAWVKDNTAAFK
ncbi:MAG TPA: SDR family oxidoreductase [Kofleriaceae bacterium]|jgi:uncharacterized protein YbjT (DUF2867 family)